MQGGNKLCGAKGMADSHTRRSASDVPGVQVKDADANAYKRDYYMVSLVFIHKYRAIAKQR
jgi:hypothetical protein